MYYASCYMERTVQYRVTNAQHMVLWGYSDVQCTAAQIRVVHSSAE